MSMDFLFLSHVKVCMDHTLMDHTLFVFFNPLSNSAYQTELNQQPSTAQRV